MIKLITIFLSLSALFFNGVHASSRGLEGRIVGGYPADAAQFPFAVAIYKQTATGTSFGVGTLINNEWILTSGQNVDGGFNFTIRVGITRLSENDPNAGTIFTDIFFLHPQYDAATLDNDIGLIKLHLPITFTDFIKPVTIVSDANLPDHSSVITLGWGQTSDSVPGTADLLQYVFLTTISNEECRQVFGNQITSNMVCVAGNYNEGICRGDIGSPLIQYGGSSQTYVVGVSSFLSSNGCESSDPSGFTRVNLYVDWINNITATN